MFAVIRTGGKQYRVTPNAVLIEPAATNIAITVFCIKAPVLERTLSPIERLSTFQQQITLSRKSRDPGAPSFDGTLSTVSGPAEFIGTRQNWNLNLATCIWYLSKRYEEVTDPDPNYILIPGT